MSAGSTPRIKGPGRSPASVSLTQARAHGHLPVGLWMAGRTDTGGGGMEPVWTPQAWDQQYLCPPTQPGEISPSLSVGLQEVLRD